MTTSPIPGESIPQSLKSENDAARPTLSPGPHNVQRPKQLESGTRIEHGDLFADVVIDTYSNPPIYHVIVQRSGSPEILRLTQEPSLEAAENTARGYVKGIARRQQRQTGT
jgi:hypothetical protein